MANGDPRNAACRGLKSSIEALETQLEGESRQAVKVKLQMQITKLKDRRRALGCHNLNNPPQAVVIQPPTNAQMNRMVFLAKEVGKKRTESARTKALIKMADDLLDTYDGISAE